MGKALRVNDPTDTCVRRKAARAPEPLPTTDNASASRRTLCSDTVSEVEVQAIVHTPNYHDVDEPMKAGVDDDDEEVD